MAKSKNTIRREWVKALRSGEYKQDTNCLKTTVGFCCLGVLCEIAKKNGVIKRYNGGMGAPPRKVQKWIGLLNFGSLITMNDRARKSFKQIAKVIESEPQRFFDSPQL